MTDNNQQEPIIRKGDDEVYEMWADRDIDVDKFVRELRKIRIEHLLGENETLDFSHLNSQ